MEPSSSRQCSVRTTSRAGFELLARVASAYCFDGALFDGVLVAGALVDFALLGFALPGFVLLDAALFEAVFLWCFLWCFWVVGFAAGVWVVWAFVDDWGAGFVCAESVDGFVCAATASDPDINTTVSAVVILLNIESSCPMKCRSSAVDFSTISLRRA